MFDTRKLGGPLFLLHIEGFRILYSPTKIKTNKENFYQKNTIGPINIDHDHGDIHDFVKCVIVYFDESTLTILAKIAFYISVFREAVRTGPPVLVNAYVQGEKHFAIKELKKEKKRNGISVTIILTMVVISVTATILDY